jgi:hypothetical protein
VVLPGYGGVADWSREFCPDLGSHCRTRGDCIALAVAANETGSMPYAGRGTSQWDWHEFGSGSQQIADLNAFELAFAIAMSKNRAQVYLTRVVGRETMHSSA